MFFFKKISLVGLGFKAFIYKGFLWLYLGLSHFMKFFIPVGLIIICKKKKIFFFSHQKKLLLDWIKQLKFFRKANIYKGKGLVEFKQFKGFVKLKKGKKQ